MPPYEYVLRVGEDEKACIIVPARNAREARPTCQPNTAAHPSKVS